MVEIKYDHSVAAVQSPAPIVFSGSGGFRTQHLSFQINQSLSCEGCLFKV